MKKFSISIIPILAFLFLGIGIIHAEEFQLSQENEKLLEQVNDMLIKNDDRPLKIIVDGTTVSKKEYWLYNSNKEYLLKVNTKTKNVELELKQAKNDSLVIVINTTKIEQLKKDLIKDLNKTQSVNKSLNNFLKDLKEEISDKEKGSDENDALETACLFILGLALLALVMIAFSS